MGNIDNRAEYIADFSDELTCADVDDIIDALDHTLGREGCIAFSEALVRNNVDPNHGVLGALLLGYMVGARDQQSVQQEVKLVYGHRQAIRNRKRNRR